MGEAADQRRAVEALELQEAAAVDDSCDQLERVEFVTEVLRDQPVEIGRVDDGLGFRIIGTIGSPQPSGIPLCTEVERIGAAAAAAAGSELGVAA